MPFFAALATICGLGLCLLGTCSFYGTPLSLNQKIGTANSTSLLPFSPAKDRHPEQDELLSNIERDFAGYGKKAGLLYGIGEGLLKDYRLAYLSLESRGGVNIHRSYDARRLSFEKLREVEAAMKALASASSAVPGDEGGQIPLASAPSTVPDTNQAAQANESGNEGNAEIPSTNDFVKQQPSIRGPLSFDRYYLVQADIDLLRTQENQQRERVRVQYAYEQIYHGTPRLANLFALPHSVSRQMYTRFDAATPYLAGAAMALGLALIALSLRRLPREAILLGRRRHRRVRAFQIPDEHWPDPNRPLYDPNDVDDPGQPGAASAGKAAVESRAAKGTANPGLEPDSAELPDFFQPPALSPGGEERLRILSDPAKFVFDSPPNEAETAALRQRIAHLEAERDAAQRYEFEQERWNLPGFQSVMQPLRRKVVADDFDFTGPHARGFDNSSSLFDFRSYRFHELPDFPAQSADLETFAKSFLTAITDLAGHCTATLYLRNRRSQYHALLRRSGSMFISGSSLGAEPIEAHLIRQLEAGRYLVFRDGLEIFFPVPCRDAGPGRSVLGVIHLHSNRSLYSEKTLRAAWYEVRKFGESLFQARIFEEAVSDFDSTLLNGMSFHRDLLHEYSLKRELRHPRQLSLLRFRGRSNPESMQYYGMALRLFFGKSCRLYRIAADVCAILGPELTPEDLERRFADCIAYLREREAVDANAGSVALRDDGAGPASAYEWFRQAGQALEDSERSGLNRLRLYQHEGVAFRRQR